MKKIIFLFGLVTFLFSSNSWGSTLYLKTAGGSCTSAGTWSNVSAAGVDSSGPPNAGDNVVAETLSGNLTIDTGCAMRSFDTTSGTGSWGGTLTHTASVVWSIGDGTAGTGNVAFKLNSGVTYTLGSSTTSELSFVSTSGIQQTITTAGKAVGRFTVNGAGSSYQLADDLTMGGTFTYTAGTTWDSNNRTITLTGASVTFNGGSKSYSGTVAITGSGSPAVAGTPTFVNFTRTGTAVKTDSLSIQSAITVTGTINLNGNSATNRIYIRSSVIGLNRTITYNGATNPNTTISNADFRDVTAAGSFGAWDLSAISGLSGDGKGNVNITFTTAATQTWDGSSGNASTSASWTSRTPLVHDNVIVNSGSVTFDMPRSGNDITFSGTPTGTFNTATDIQGSLTLVSGMTFSQSATITLNSRTSSTITSATKTLTNVTQSGFGGTYVLQDALTMSGTYTLANGSFLNTGNFPVQLLALSSAVANVRAWNLGTATWTFTGTGTVINLVSGSMTLTSTGSTILISDTSSTSKTVATSGLTLYDVKFAGGGSGQLIFTGAATLNRLYSDGGGTKSIVLPGSTTITILSGLGLENGTHVITFTASAGSATISKSSGIVRWDYVNLTNIPSTGGAVFYAGEHSTNGGGNTGWSFTAAPTTKPIIIVN